MTKLTRKDEIECIRQVICGALAGCERCMAKLDDRPVCGFSVTVARRALEVIKPEEEGDSAPGVSQD